MGVASAAACCCNLIVIMDALNKKLADKSYVEGYTPTSSDVEALASVPDDLDAAKFPNVARWARHIRSFSEAERSAWGGASKSAAAPAAEEEDDDDVDLFGSDDEEDEELEAERNRRLAESEAKKKEKVKPFDDETDLNELETKIRAITMEGLEWKAAKLEDIAFGIQKLVISCHVEDDKVGVDLLEEKIMEFDDDVQSVDIAAFNKL